MILGSDIVEVFWTTFWFQNQIISSLPTPIKTDILFLNPRLRSRCLLDLLVLAAGAVGSSSLSCFDVEEAGHFGYVNETSSP